MCTPNQELNHLIFSNIYLPRFHYEKFFGKFFYFIFYGENNFKLLNYFLSGSNILKKLI